MDTPPGPPDGPGLPRTVRQRDARTGSFWGGAAIGLLGAFAGWMLLLPVVMLAPSLAALVYGPPVAFVVLLTVGIALLIRRRTRRTGIGYLAVCLVLGLLLLDPLTAVFR